MIHRIRFSLPMFKDIFRYKAGQQELLGNIRLTQNKSKISIDDTIFEDDIRESMNEKKGGVERLQRMRLIKHQTLRSS